MPRTVYKTCPNCGVKAIVVLGETKPSEVVTCTVCQAEYKLKELQ